MKKHIFGLALFSCIVGAAVIIYAVFNVPEIVQVYEVVSTPQYVATTKTSCRMRELNESRSDSAVITQAVYSVKTGKISWKCSSSKLEDFHIWLKDEKGARYLHSFVTENCFEGEGTTAVYLPFSDSRRKLHSQENLYLTPDAALDENTRKMKFDVNKAIPVTIDYGR